MRISQSHIVLNHLRFHAYHGVMAQERKVGNDYDVSVRLEVPIDRAALSDEVADTIDYGEVYKLICQEMMVPSNLVERVAYRVGDRLMRRYPSIVSVDVEILKLNPPIGACCEGAGVQIHLINDKTQ